MEQPRFLPNTVVFAIPDNNSGYGGFNWIGEYKITKVAVVPKFVGSKEIKFIYYATVAGAMYMEVELLHVFKDKTEFIDFIKGSEFRYCSPKEN